MLLKLWAAKYRLSSEAMTELRHIIRTEEVEVFGGAEGMSEAGVSSRVRLEASKKGCILWRNNVGAYQTDTGSYVRYGLANDSKRVNERVKSSDLIGIRPVLITQELVGRVIGQFLARETKEGGWHYTGKDREVAQKNYIELVKRHGGDACFAVGEGTL